MKAIKRNPKAIENILNEFGKLSDTEKMKYGLGLFLDTFVKNELHWKDEEELKKRFYSIKTNIEDIEWAHQEDAKRRNANYDFVGKSEGWDVE